MTDASRRVRPFYRAMWIPWSALTATVLAVLTTTTPDRVDNAAYTLAFDLLPIRWWAVVFWTVTVALTATVALWHAHQYRVSLHVLRFGLGVQAVAHFTFGLSLLVHTINGTTAAAAGVVQWWTTSVISVWALTRPFTEPAGGADARRF